jgi:hypothetical protein
MVFNTTFNYFSYIAVVSLIVGGVIKFVSDLLQVRGFLRVLLGQRFSPGTTVSSNNETDHRNITEIVKSGVKHHNPSPNPP